MATPPPIASGRYFCEVWLASCLNLTPDRAVMSINVGEGLEIATAGESSARSNCRRVRAVTFWAPCARVLVCKNIPTLNLYCLLFQTWRTTFCQSFAPAFHLEGAFRPPKWPFLHRHQTVYQWSRRHMSHHFERLLSNPAVSPLR